VPAPAPVPTGRLPGPPRRPASSRNARHRRPRHSVGSRAGDDWENVITPVADYLRSQPDVDSGRIVLNGSSLLHGLQTRNQAVYDWLDTVLA
jgi:hypothetical protein